MLLSFGCATPGGTAGFFLPHTAVESGALDAQEAFIIAPTAGTIHNMQIRPRVVGTGTNTMTLTVRVNGVASSVAATIASNATTASDTTNSVAVSAGDKISLRAVFSGTVNGAGYRVGLQLNVTITATSAITLSPLTLASTADTPNIGTSAITLGALGVSGGAATPNTGTSSITLGAMTASGTSPNEGTGAITLGLAAAGVAATPNIGTSAITLGGLIVAASGTVLAPPTGGMLISFGCALPSGAMHTATTAGFFLPHTAVEVGILDANEAFVIAPAPGILQKMYVAIRDPGVGSDTITLTVRVNSVPSSLSATISESATATSNTTDIVAVDAGDRISLRASFNAGPISAEGIRVSMLLTAFDVDGIGSILLDAFTVVGTAETPRPPTVLDHSAQAVARLAQEFRFETSGGGLLQGKAPSLVVPPAPVFELRTAETIDDHADAAIARLAQQFRFEPGEN